MEAFDVVLINIPAAGGGGSGVYIHIYLLCFILFVNYLLGSGRWLKGFLEALVEKKRVTPIAPRGAGSMYIYIYIYIY